jgi:hypothetical protein
VNAWKQDTEALGGKFPSGNPNPCAAPGADQIADLLFGPEADPFEAVLANVTADDLARLLEDAPGLPDLCALTAEELEDLAPDADLDPDPEPPSLEDLTRRVNAGLQALALLLAASAEILQVARAAQEGGPA